MANLKITAFPELTTTIPSDVLPIVDLNTSITKKIQVQNLLPNATTSSSGVVEIATAGETTTGTDASRAVSPNGLVHSDFGKRVVQVKVIDDATALTTGNNKITYMIPAEYNGYNLVTVEGFNSTVSSSGVVNIQIANSTDNVNMLSTALTIDASEYTSYTAAIPSVIDTTHDDVATGDLIRIDVNLAGTGAKGTGVVMSFQLP